MTNRWWDKSSIYFKKRGKNMTIAEIVALVVSIIGCCGTVSAIYFAIKNSKQQAEKDSKERLEQNIADVKKRTEENTKMNMKLDEINRNVTDVKFDMSATKKEVQQLSEKFAVLENSVKTAHHRIDTVEERLNKLEE